MCLDPMTMAGIGMAMSAVSAVATYSAQEDAADKQSAVIAQKQSLAKMDNERQIQQQTEQDAAEANAHAMQARKDMASLEALNSEFGVGSNTANRKLTTVGIQQSQDTATIASNSMKGLQELGLQGWANDMSAESQQKAVQRPSLLAAGLTIGSGAMTYSKQLDRINNPKSVYNYRD